MITAVIVLFIVALALGGFIAWDILRGRKHAPASAQSAAPETQSAEEGSLSEPPAPLDEKQPESVTESHENPKAKQDLASEAPKASK